MNKKPTLTLIATLLVLFLMLPVVRAASNENAAYYLSRFIDSLINLWNGDSNGFSRSLVDSLPLFAVFLMIFVIIWFLSSETIFRGAQNPKLSIVLGIAMALIAIWTPTVFQFIMKLGTITIVVITIITFILLGTVAQKRASIDISSANTELARIRQSEFKEVKDAKRLEQDLRVEATLQDKERNELVKAEEELKSLLAADKDIATTLKSILNTLAHINGVRSEGEKAKYISLLQSQLSAVNAKLATRINRLKDIKTKVLNLEKDMKKKNVIAQDDAKRVKELLEDAKRTPKENDKKIIEIVNEEVSNMEKLIKEEEELAQSIKKLEILDEEDNARLKNAIQDSINSLYNHNINNAMTEINNALHLLSITEKYELEIGQIENKIADFENRIKTIERNIDAAIRQIE
ncbi:MAG: hypothetical protein QXW00_01690 [Candidatus Woesearchaeota archaeon]